MIVLAILLAEHIYIHIYIITIYNYIDENFSEFVWNKIQLNMRKRTLQ